MPTISWFSDQTQIPGGSGLGFYGAGGFGASIRVGEWNDYTFITNSNGTVNAAQADNVKWTHPNSGTLGGGASVDLLKMPNKDVTLNIRFEHTSPVQVTNVTLYGYDRSNINNNPSGVTLRAAEIIHDSISQSVTGSGDSSWTTLAGSSVTLSLCPSPGVSGAYAGNGSSSTWTDTRHDHFVAMTVSPDSIGSKLFAVYVSYEYL